MLAPGMAQVLDQNQINAVALAGYAQGKGSMEAALRTAEAAFRSDAQEHAAERRSADR
jgi:hypothetical protein